MTTNKPAPYAPDLFSEHARLAQLGAKVLEILHANAGKKTELETVLEIGTVAFALGLLEERRAGQ